LAEPKVCPLLEGGPRARLRFSGVGFPCPSLGSGEARSCPLNGPILDLIAPIRPLQLCADGGYQLRFRGLEGTPNYGPRHYRPLEPLSSSGTGQALFTIRCASDFCSDFCYELYSCQGTVQSTVAPKSRCSAVTPDSPVAHWTVR
jgi:hypothetical protein